MAALGLGVGLSVVPQRHRLFSLVPRVAPVALGLNGSAIYVASALGAVLGGAVLALTGTTALAPAAAVVGLLAITIGSAVRPERSTHRATASQG